MFLVLQSRFAVDSLGSSRHRFLQVHILRINRSELLDLFLGLPASINRGVLVCAVYPALSKDLR